jgi:hypothetical protein
MEENEFISIIKTQVDGKDAIKLSFYGDSDTLSSMLLSAMKNHPFIAMSMIYAVDNYSYPEDDKSMLN